MKKHLKPLLACLLVAYAARLFGQNVTPSTMIARLMIAIFLIGSGLAITDRGHKTLSTSFVALFLLPTPLMGAAKILGWLMLFAAISSTYTLTFQGSASSQLIAVILLTITLYIFYLTPISTVINIYRDTGEMLSLKT